MNIAWISRKGNSRHFNNDAVALAYIGQSLLVVIVDGAERFSGRQFHYGKNAHGKRLPTYWADRCVQAVKAQPKALVCEQTLISLLAAQQSQLRHHYLFDIASYGLLILDTQTGNARWWYTGDCRIGLESNAGSINWINPPHRLDKFLLLDDEAPFDPQAMQAARSTLTKTLNARRFVAPDRIETRLPLDGAGAAKLVLATDGYWCEHLQDKTEFKALNDDASLLTIKPGRKHLQLNSDVPNLLITYR